MKQWEQNNYLCTVRRPRLFPFVGYGHRHYDEQNLGWWAAKKKVHDTHLKGPAVLEHGDGENGAFTSTWDYTLVAEWLRQLHQNHLKSLIAFHSWATPTQTAFFFEKSGQEMFFIHAWSRVHWCLIQESENFSTYEPGISWFWENSWFVLYKIAMKNSVSDIYFLV